MFYVVGAVMYERLNTRYRLLLSLTCCFILYFHRRAVFNHDSMLIVAVFAVLLVSLLLVKLSVLLMINMSSMLNILTSIICLSAVLVTTLLLI